MVIYYKKISQDRLLRVISEFKDDCLKLTVLDNNTAWETTVDKAKLTTYAKDQTFESYYSSLQKYFQPPLKSNEELNFANGELNVRTTLKNHMKMVLFHTSMQQLDFTDTVYTKLDEFNRNTSELNRVRADYAALQQDYEVRKKKMDEFLERRQTEELTVYNKFVGILNEKKFQIHHLNELLTAFRGGRPTVNPPPPPVRSEKAPKTEHIQESDSSDSDVPEPKRFARESPQPSTSKIHSPQSLSPSDNETEVKKDQTIAINFNTQELLNEL